MTERDIRRIIGDRFGIERNVATPGEWVIWTNGAGHPVYSVSDVRALLAKIEGKGVVRRQTELRSRQWGIYLDGDLVEGGFFSLAQAKRAALTYPWPHIVIR